MNQPFTHGNVEWSSQRHIIDVGARSLPRKAFHRDIIDKEISAFPSVGGEPVYIATGGGYAANDPLISYEKSNGSIDADIPSINGRKFRDHPWLLREKEKVENGLKSQMGQEELHNNPNAVQQTALSYYSDEVNTKIAKEIVLGALRRSKSVIYESSASYQDTITRAKLAKEHGMKTLLLAGDMNVEEAIRRKPDQEPFNVATSFQKFAARFEYELVPLFDEIRLYNTDGAEPKLIAQKEGAGQSLVIRDAELYQTFLAKARLEPAHYASATQAMNTVAAEHARSYEEPGFEYGQKGPPVAPLSQDIPR